MGSREICTRAVRVAASVLALALALGGCGGGNGAVTGNSLAGPGSAANAGSAATPGSVLGSDAAAVVSERSRRMAASGTPARAPLRDGSATDWYDHDVTIDGILFHVYAAKDPDGALRPTFNGGWKFIVFEPDRPIPPGTLDLAKIVNYVATRKDAFGTPWATGKEYAVSVELGVEPEWGVGDIQVSNYRVWR